MRGRLRTRPRFCYSVGFVASTRYEILCSGVVPIVHRLLNTQIQIDASPRLGIRRSTTVGGARYFSQPREPAAASPSWGILCLSTAAGAFGAAVGLDRAASVVAASDMKAEISEEHAAALTNATNGETSTRLNFFTDVIKNISRVFVLFTAFMPALLTIPLAVLIPGVQAKTWHLLFNASPLVAEFIATAVSVIPPDFDSFILNVLREAIRTYTPSPYTAKYMQGEARHWLDGRKNEGDDRGGTKLLMKIPDWDGTPFRHDVLSQTHHALVTRGGKQSAVAIKVLNSRACDNYLRDIRLFSAAAVILAPFVAPQLPVSLAPGQIEDVVDRIGATLCRRCDLRFEAADLHSIAAACDQHHQFDVAKVLFASSGVLVRDAARGITIADRATSGDLRRQRSGDTALLVAGTLQSVFMAQALRGTLHFGMAPHHVVVRGGQGGMLTPTLVSVGPSLHLASQEMEPLRSLFEEVSLGESSPSGRPKKPGDSRLAATGERNTRPAAKPHKTLPWCVSEDNTCELLANDVVKMLDASDDSNSSHSSVPRVRKVMSDTTLRLSHSRPLFETPGLLFGLACASSLSEIDLLVPTWSVLDVAESVLSIL